MTKYEYLEGNSDSTEARSFRFSARARFAPVGVHPPARSKSQNATSPTNPNPVQKRASRHSSTRGRASTTLHTHNGVCLRWYGVGGEPLGSSGERRARAPAGTSPDGTSRTARRHARCEHRARRFPSTSRAGARRPRRRRPLRNVRRRGVLGSVVLAPLRPASRTGRPFARRPAASAPRSPAAPAFTKPRPRKPTDALSTSPPNGRFARPFARRSR